MFIDRDDGGKVTAWYRVPQREGQEETADDHPDLAAYNERLTNPVPAQVSAGQLIKALGELGLLVAVDAAVAQADAMTQRLWARAAFFPRNDPVVVATGGALGKTSAELDDIFRLAATK